METDIAETTCWAYITRNFGYEKAVGAMGTVFAHNGEKWNRVTVSEERLPRTQRNPRGFLRLHTEDQGTVQAVDFSGPIGPKESKDHSISCEGQGDH